MGCLKNARSNAEPSRTTDKWADPSNIPTEPRNEEANFAAALPTKHSIYSPLRMACLALRDFIWYIIKKFNF